MKEIAQKLKEGRIQLIEVTPPQVRSRDVLVRNAFSCISPGTESSTVKAAQKSYIGKARERPQQFQEVINKLKTQGPIQTYRAVMKKLDAYSPLGYSCVGQVIEVGPEVTSLAVGDYAACGGGTACHAEIVAVPENLCVKVDRETDFKQAAYNTLGAIAMQGVRQAGMQLNESCAVIGLGLLGHLTCSLLRASGVRVVAVDIDQRMVDIAGVHCADLALRRDEDGAEQRIRDFTGGKGCDGVIITASANTVDPINFAGAIARKRGTIVVVGAVPTGFDREPHFYQKELAVKMSCSYGPGRYDQEYEEKGKDYPYAYVRWTERRNMESFQDLIQSRRIDIGYLTTHVVKLEDAPAAYEMIVQKTAPFVGILIEYGQSQAKPANRLSISVARHLAAKPAKVGIGFIGAGSYAQGHLLPNIAPSRDIVLKGVMTGSPSGSRSVAERFRFEFCTNNADDIIGNEEINTVFIATRHESHARYALSALRAGKNVFVEKPLCLRPEELDEIDALVSSGEGGGMLMVGYNRRFAPLTAKLKGKTGAVPISMLYRVNAGSIPPDSWIQDMEVGGGRIIGEVCHFIDYLTHISGSLPVSVSAIAMDDPHGLHDTLTIALQYRNGSIGSVCYFANGSRMVPKEYVEIFRNGTTSQLNDFREVTLFGAGKPEKERLLLQDKGQKNEVRQFLEAVQGGKPAPIPYEEIRSTSLVTFGVLESLRSGQTLTW